MISKPLPRPMPMKGENNQRQLVVPDSGKIAFVSYAEPRGERAERRGLWYNVRPLGEECTTTGADV